MLSSLLSSTLLWASSWLLYRSLLAPLACHRFNRAYLIAALLLGATAPWLVSVLPGLSTAAYLPELPTITLPELIVSAEGTPVIANSGSATPWWLPVYLFGVLVSLAILARDIYSIHALRQNSVPVTGIGARYGMEVRQTSTDTAPCSWGNTLYVGNWDSLSGPEHEAILVHEATHWKLHHRADVLLASFTCAAAWFNPFVYALRRELRLVHEYQADRQVVLTASYAADYQKILLNQQLGIRPLALAPAFNHSPLKNRFLMMTNSFGRKQLWRPVLAALTLLIFAASCAKEEPTEIELAGIAEANSEESLILSADGAMEGYELTGTDTITMFDPETYAETVQIVRNFTNTATGEFKSQQLPANDLTRDGSGEAVAQEMIRSMPVYKVVDEMPHFPGGNCTGTSEEIEDCHMEMMLKHVYSQVKYPDIAREKGVEGTALVSFIVGTDGELLEPSFPRVPSNGDLMVTAAITAELTKVIDSMPAWTPGKIDGTPVQVRFNLPIKFRLE